MKFFKYHGTGNDFICFDNIKGDISLDAQQVSDLCDRHFGVGADGVIIMSSSENGDVFMDYRNSDGSLAEMCGNGVRITAKFIQDHWNINSSEILIDTRDGVKRVSILDNDYYQVNMGAPCFTHSDFPDVSYEREGITWNFTSMGNPHAVGVFPNEQILDAYFEKHGKAIESNLELFPEKINVNFVWQKSDFCFGVKTFERGAGPTLSCGTGASASFSWIQKLFPSVQDKKIQIDIPGGTLFFEYSTNGEILMTGPACSVFSGNI